MTRTTLLSFHQYHLNCNMATSASSKRKGSSSDEGSSEEGCHEPSGGRTTNKILHITLYQKVEQLVRAVVLLVLLITSAPCFLALLALVVPGRVGYLVKRKDTRLAMKYAKHAQSVPFSARRELSIRFTSCPRRVISRSKSVPTAASV